MSDTDGDTKERKGGYRFEYSPNNRAKCKGPKPCNGTTLVKGEIRVGSVVDFKGHTSLSWRHWGCVTPKMISNMKNIHDDADELDGFEDLNADDQAKIRKAWEEGHVADEDIPESARKPAGDEKDEEEADGSSSKTKKKAAGKAEGEVIKGTFKLEYASSGRAKCKGDCQENIGKDYFRIGTEVDFRGNKSFQWQHWGCAPATLIEKLKASYDDPESIEGFSDLKEAEQEKVRAAWEAGEIPEDDKGPGEPVASVKKKPAPRKKKADADEERPKKRAKKAKDEDDEEEEEEKPKKKAPAKKAAPAKKPAAKKAPAKKGKKVDSESEEDFGDEIDKVSGDEEEDEEEEDSSSKKRKRPPPSKSKATSSKPPSKAAAPAKPASKRGAASKPASKPSSRAKKVPVYAEESDEDEDEDD
ncbi:hypothetical protein C8Q75DRAFT_122329 [Abortiporus biennis]|nr:hypothetical protein C8Q75DRAFT_122329 [Abortiporus biennis]